MLRRLVHRGPDDEGSITLPGAWLGHRRLSIVDTTGGHQPLTTSDGHLYMVGNGEIYNHEELREVLTDSEFLTGSDNEVALQLVNQEGLEGLEQLGGMFAFVIAGADGTFIAARDPVGIKPLYWAQRDGQTVFASEIKAFDLDWQSDVEQFPSGYYWTPESGLIQFAQSVTVREPDPFPLQEPGDSQVPVALIDDLRATLVDSIERHMMGDVPVGVFLSGGLDSSIVAAVAGRYASERGESLHTFAVGSVDSPDLEFARLMADRIGSIHHERVFTAADAAEVLPEVIGMVESFDSALVRSCVPNYFLAEMAGRTVKVVLTGEGADELFAGYEYQRAFDNAADLHAELIRGVESLHGLNLQRCDRMTMAHGVEARVPFLDGKVIDFSLAIPPEWKLPKPGRPEKWLLRKAFEGLVPDEVLWREKATFDEGSGAADALRGESDVDSEMAWNNEFEQASEGVPNLRSEEEAEYYRIFCEYFGDVSADRTISRFATA